MSRLFFGLPCTPTERELLTRAEVEVSTLLLIESVGAATRAMHPSMWRDWRTQIAAR